MNSIFVRPSLLGILSFLGTISTILLVTGFGQGRVAIAAPDFKMSVNCTSCGVDEKARNVTATCTLEGRGETGQNYLLEKTIQYSESYALGKGISKRDALGICRAAVKHLKSYDGSAYELGGVADQFQLKTSSEECSCDWEEIEDEHHIVWPHYACHSKGSIDMDDMGRVVTSTSGKKAIDGLELAFHLSESAKASAYQNPDLIPLMDMARTKCEAAREMLRKANTLCWE